jgi:hypothetical protein
MGVGSQRSTRRTPRLDEVRAVRGDHCVVSLAVGECDTFVPGRVWPAARFIVPRPTNTMQLNDSVRLAPTAYANLEVSLLSTLRRTRTERIDQASQYCHSPSTAAVAGVDLGLPRPSLPAKNNTQSKGRRHTRRSQTAGNFCSNTPALCPPRRRGTRPCRLET